MKDNFKKYFLIASIAAWFVLWGIVVVVINTDYDSVIIHPDTVQTYYLCSLAIISGLAYAIDTKMIRKPGLISLFGIPSYAAVYFSIVVTITNNLLWLLSIIVVLASLMYLSLRIYLWILKQNKKMVNRFNNYLCIYIIILLTAVIVSTYFILN